MTWLLAEEESSAGQKDQRQSTGEVETRGELSLQENTKDNTKSSLVSEEERGGSLLGADGVTSTNVKEKAELLNPYFAPELHR